MMAWSKTFRGVLLALVGGIVIGCAPRGELAVRNATPFATQAAEDVFIAGYASITKKYIDNISVATLAMEGMRGLGAIDPALSVRRSGNTVILSESGWEVAQFPAPADDDVDGWAALTVQVSVAGRGASADLRTVNAEKLYEAVFDGVLSNLDIFSRYAGAEEASRNRAKRDGFGGVGIRFRIRDGAISVTEVLPNTPASRAGVRVGDQITHVGTVPVVGLRSRDVVAQLRGPINSKIEITVRRSDVERPLHVAMERAHIVPPTVFSHRDGGIATFRISSFNQHTTRTLIAQIKRAREELGDAIKGAVLDLRGNPGGLLKQAINIADVFLTQGNILRTRGRHPDSHQHYEAGGRDLARGLPLVILVDGKSASASEILAAALQDRGRAVVIGTTSFGKGTVQTVIRLPNDGEITLTWSRLIAPSGYVLHGLGVHPSICTSGSDGKGVIKRVLDDRAEAAATMRAWRTSGFNDDDQRQELRATCPAQRRPDSVETELARRLLADRALYSRALDLSAVTTAAGGDQPRRRLRPGPDLPTPRP